VFNSRIAAAARTAVASACIGVAGVFLVAACSSSETASPPSSKSTPTPSSAGPSGALGDLSVAPTASPAAAVPGVYGDPAAVAKYWRAQSLEDNCGLMSVADIVGQTTGQQPTEEQILALAENTPSVVNPGTQIYAPRNDPSHTNGNGGVSMGDLVALLDHYGIKSTMTSDEHPDQTGMPAVQQYIGAGRKVIAYVNSAVVWNTSDQRTTADHFLVVTGVDTNKDIVHLNDPGADHSDEQVPTATFATAWETSGDSIVFTAPPS
jgi:predicted double-glycine peptidase